MSSRRAQRRREARICARKVRHRTAGAAYWASVMSTRVYGDPYGLGYYRCGVCGLWHVGHAPGGKHTRASFRGAA